MLALRVGRLGIVALSAAIFAAARSARESGPETAVGGVIESATLALLLAAPALLLAAPVDAAALGSAPPLRREQRARWTRASNLAGVEGSSRMVWPPTLRGGGPAALRGGGMQVGAGSGDADEPSLLFPTSMGGGAGGGSAAAVCGGEIAGAAESSVEAFSSQRMLDCLAVLSTCSGGGAHGCGCGVGGSLDSGVSAPSCRSISA